MGHMTMGVKVDESINKPCINAISACADTSQIVVAGRSGLYYGATSYKNHYKLNHLGQRLEMGRREVHIVGLFR